MRDHPLWRGARRPARRRGRRRRARLLAGRPGARGGDLQARRRRQADVVTAAADMSGIENAFVAIAAETFGLAEDSVRVVTGDTSSTPFGGVSGGTKVTYTVGRAVERAADEARERLLQVAATELEIAPEDLEIVDGEVRPVGAPSRGDRDRRPGAKTYTFGSPHEPIEGYGGVAQISRAPGAPRTSRTCASTARPAPSTLLAPRDRPGRRQGAQPRAGRGPDARRHRAGHRLGAATRSSPTTSTASCARARSSSTRSRRPSGAAGRHRDRRGPRARRPVRRQGHRRAAGVRRRRAAVANAIAAATGARMRELPMTPVRVWAALNNGAG